MQVWVQTTVIMNVSSGSECATPSECGNDGDASPDGLAAEQIEILNVDSDSEATVSVPSNIHPKPSPKASPNGSALAPYRGRLPTVAEG